MSDNTPDRRQDHETRDRINQLQEAAEKTIKAGRDMTEGARHAFRLFSIAFAVLGCFVIGGIAIQQVQNANRANEIRELVLKTNEERFVNTVNSCIAKVEDNERNVRFVTRLMGERARAMAMETYPYPTKNDKTYELDRGTAEASCARKARETVTIR